MLVQFSKGFIMEGRNTIIYKKHFWSKPQEREQTIYYSAAVSGFCDSSKVEEEVERLVHKKLETDSGWGRKFLGWHKVLTYEESLAVAKKEDWDEDYIDRYLPSGEIIINTLENWTVEKAMQNLTAPQFVQYCKDYGISCLNKT